ncbi:MAG: phosphoglycerate kinase [Spirochaetia bacterium]|nr:phosphoglycerate kinase [Spirochaetia bacterium]
MKNIKGIEDLDVHNEKVLLRVDFNVPLDPATGDVIDPGRMIKSLPTIELLLKKGASIIIISHLGRPKNTKDLNLSLFKVTEKLKELLPKVNIQFCPFDQMSKMSSISEGLKPGEIIVLDNIRFFPEETSEKEQERKKFAQKLSTMGDIFVNDAFGACHREHASVYELASFLPSCAGLLLQKEVNILNRALTSPERPFTAIIGGSKVSSKIEVIDQLIKRVDHIIIGGAMAYTFLKSRGLRVGNSKVENDILSQASQIIDKAQFNECGFYLPEDHVISMDFSENGKIKPCGLEIPEGWMGMDIGQKTIKKYEKIIGDSKTILWNGPMGVFEMDAFSEGTMSIAKSVSKVKGTTIVGGGDSMLALKKSGLENKITHISTGGGATLEFLEGKQLPGLKALIVEE